MTNLDSLSCLLWNVRSLNNKVLDVMSYLDDKCIDIFFVTETWLIDDNNAQTSLIRESSCYNIFHTARKTRGGGYQAKELGYFWKMPNVFGCHSS